MTSNIYSRQTSRAQRSFIPPASAPAAKGVAHVARVCVPKLSDLRPSVGFRAVAEAVSRVETEYMYRAEAVRHIVRDVTKRLPKMRQTVPWANWRMAVIMAHSAHPEWFKHNVTFESLEPALRAAGVDMTEPDGGPSFSGNVASVE